MGIPSQLLNCYWPKPCCRLFSRRPTGARTGPIGAPQASRLAYFPSAPEEDSCGAQGSFCHCLHHVNFNTDLEALFE